MTDFIPKVASKQDLAAVLSWLRWEYEWTSSDGSFWHNRSTITDAQADNRLYVLAADNRVAGFLVGSLNGDLSMMEVRPELRRHGLGRQLVEHYLDCIRQAGGLGARVECQPSSSTPFWKRLGFRPYFDRQSMATSDGDRFDQTPQRLARILSIDNEIPVDALRVPIELAFVDPINRIRILPPFTTEAARIGTEWHFATPFCEYFSSGDSYLLLTIRGEDVWFDKVKRIDKVGGKRCAGMTRLCRFTMPTEH